MSYVDSYGKGRHLVNGDPRELEVDGRFEDDEIDFTIPFDDPIAPYTDTDVTRVTLTLEDVIRLRDDLTAKINTIKLIKDALQYFKKNKAVSKKNHIDIEIALICIELGDILNIEELQRLEEFAPGFRAAISEYAWMDQRDLTDSIIRGEVSSVTFLQAIVGMAKG